MLKKITNRADCVFTGQGVAFGGSSIRSESTGYGTVDFAREMLARAGKSLGGMRVALSGSGNVAQYGIEKWIEMKAKVVTVSDSGGTVIDEAGFTTEKLATLMETRTSNRVVSATMRPRSGHVTRQG